MKKTGPCHPFTVSLFWQINLELKECSMHCGARWSQTSVDAFRHIFSAVPGVIRCFCFVQHHTPYSRWPSWGWSNLSLYPDGRLANLLPWFSSFSHSHLEALSSTLVVLRIALLLLCPWRTCSGQRSCWGGATCSTRLLRWWFSRRQLGLGHAASTIYHALEAWRTAQYLQKCSTSGALWAYWSICFAPCMEVCQTRYHAGHCLDRELDPVCLALHSSAQVFFLSSALPHFIQTPCCFIATTLQILYTSIAALTFLWTRQPLSFPLTL